MVDQLLSAFGDKMIMAPYRYAGAGFSPPDLPNLDIWFDYTDLSTLWQDSGSTQVTTPGQSVGQWDDKSGNGYNLVQTTPSERPTYQSSGVFFDGNDFIRNLTTRVGADLFGTYFIVFNVAFNTGGIAFTNGRIAGTLTQAYFNLHRTSINALSVALRVNGGSLGSSDFRELNGSRYDDSSNHILSVQAASADNETWVDGSSDATDAVFTGVPTNDLDTYCLGRLDRAVPTGYYTGYVLEVARYTDKKSDADRQIFENYAIAKYSI